MKSQSTRTSPSASQMQDMLTQGYNYDEHHRLFFNPKERLIQWINESGEFKKRTMNSGEIWDYANFSHTE